MKKYFILTVVAVSVAVIVTNYKELLRMQKQKASKPNPPGSGLNTAAAKAVAG